MISKLINSYDICFFIEHWLSNEEAYKFNKLCSDQSILFNADYSTESRLTRGRGRPFGGRCWTVHKRFTVVEYVVISQALSKIVVEGPNISRTTLLGIWQPFDNGSLDRMVSSSLSFSAGIRN